MGCIISSQVVEPRHETLWWPHEQPSMMQSGWSGSGDAALPLSHQTHFSLPAFWVLPVINMPVWPKTSAVCM